MVGDRLKELRKKEKLSRDAMAAVAKVSSSTFFNYENNRTQPNMRSLLLISQHFNVPMSYFYRR